MASTKTSAAKKKPSQSWPASTPENWPLDKIKPYERNPRTHPEAQIKLLASLMKKWGVDQPIVVDESGVILKGHGRRLAAIEAGFKEFPVVVHRGLPEADKSSIRIADNQSSLLSEWDQGMLRAEVMELKMSGADLPLLGFEDATLNWLGDGVAVMDPQGEWGAMPAFNMENKEAFRSLIVHFKDPDAVEQFEQAIGQKLPSEKTKFIWYPQIEIEAVHDKMWVGKEGEA